MSLKKLLGIISVVIVVTFALMLTTSYAWYSFENASTKFEVATNTKDVIVSYQTGEYINTTIAVPISSNDVDKYSEKNNFSIKVKDNREGNEMVATISLADIVIDEVLRNNSFIIDFYHQGSKVSTITGDSVIVDENPVKELGTVSLLDDIDNNFELRVYILDDGTDQSTMMGMSFQAKIQINVVSRIKTSFEDYNNPDINIAKIVIDGNESDSLPIDGYYTMKSICAKGSELTWDSLNKTIIYGKASFINDSCSLEFTSSNEYPLLNKMNAGSYVKYVGNNGCVGKSCNGENANYISDTNMGYCQNSNYKYITNGWRIAYVEDGSAYLISAGATECMCTNKDGKSSNKECKDNTLDLETHIKNINKVALNYCNKKYIKDGKCDNTNVWAMKDSDYQKILKNSLKACYNKYSDKSCGYTNDLIDNGGYYWFGNSFENSNDSVFIWNSERRISAAVTENLSGVRPVLKLDEKVTVIGGSGTYSDPYIISNK